MRRLSLFYILFILISYINAQVVENPVFDRTDVPSFRVKKIEIQKDTTYIYCLYSAEAGSWANISDKTYIEDVRNGEIFPIIKVSGIPFGPEKRYFTDSEEVDIILYFPHVSTDKINIIEKKEAVAFNIYGINFTHTYITPYTSTDIHHFFEFNQKNEEEQNWSIALEYAQKQLEATNYVEGIQSFASACAMYNMMLPLFELKNYEKAIEWGLKIIDIVRELPKDSIYLDVLARTYGTVGTAYWLLKENDVAAEYNELSLAVRRLKDGVGTLNYEEYLGHLAKNYYYEQNYPKALLYGKEVMNIYKKKYTENLEYESDYITALNNLSSYYLSMDKVEEAISCGKLALEIYDRGDRCKKFYPLVRYRIYHNIALAFLKNGQTDEGIDLLEMATKAGDNETTLHARLSLAMTYLDIKQDTIRTLNEYEKIEKIIEDSMSIEKKNNQLYMKVLSGLYQIHSLKNPNVAMQYLNKAINFLKKWHGDNSIAYANWQLEKIKNVWVSSVVEHFRSNTDIDSLLINMRNATDIVKRKFNNSLYNMSKYDRNTYWCRYESFYTWLIPTICGIVKSDIGNSLAYDAALFYKGILLSYEKDFKEVIADERDSSLIAIYKDYIRNISQIEEQYTKGASPLLIDSLNKIINDEEFTLCQKVSRFNRQYKGTNLSWTEIKDCLTEGEVAIEIVSYKKVLDDDILYDAYLIDYNSEFPQKIFLCSETQLDSLIRDSIDYIGLSHLIWGNEALHDAIKYAKNIYFSASGLLNMIAIEYLPIAENQYINDRFNLYRLSSTRELCIKDNVISIDNAYLYGGLDYNRMEDKPNKEIIPDRLSRSAVEALTHRGGFDFLAGSKQEVEQIKNILLKHKKGCFIFSGAEGTEESIKNLSGRKLGLLHLSTHGMYVQVNDDERIKELNNYHFIRLKNTPNVDYEDMSLSHSFLVMSGGNALIHRDSLSVGNEDGILTALEISHLDFTHLDLVVLSACETALGRIYQEEVYGLQRGFKKAGANTILMSLGKVDDEATRILMVEFYRNLMNGKTKLQSLKEAQQYLRKVDNGKYDAPKYWASFIMLDGLN
jgi:tetratricopeptide (TPR) repeat protein